MLLNKKILPLIILISLLPSCIEPFMPETAKYDYSLFIEALVTDEPGFLPEVNISATIPIKTSGEEDIIYTPDIIRNAEVFLLCNDGSEYEFEQPEAIGQNGTYRLSDPGFVAETGKSYKIIIYLDGDVFESGFETLRESPAIDSIGYKVKTKKLSEVGITAKGYEFLISNHNSATELSYYRWLLDATYYYTVPYESNFMWDGRRLIPFKNDTLMVCWKDKYIRGIYLSTTEGLTENSIIEAPLNFESQYGDELTRRYSLHVKQLSISQESYYFWNEIHKMVYESGGLFERQPFRISGNITCTSNTELSVIGILEVAGVSESREFFISPDEFPVWGFSCMIDTCNTEAYPLDALPVGSFVFVDEATGAIVTSAIPCYDCRARGGTTRKPAFWEF